MCRCGASALQSPAIRPSSPPDSPSHSQSVMPPGAASRAECGEYTLSPPSMARRTIRSLAFEALTLVSPDQIGG